MLAPRPTPKLEDHPLSAVHDCLFNLFAATLHIGGLSSSRNLRTRHAVVTGTHYTWAAMYSVGKFYYKVIFSLSTYVRICDSTAEIRISINSASEHARRHISWKTQNWWWNMVRTRRTTFLHLLQNGTEQRYPTFLCCVSPVISSIKTPKSRRSKNAASS